MPLYRSLIIGLILLNLNACFSLRQPDPQTQVETQGKTFTTAFYSGELESLWKAMAPRMKQALKDQDTFARTRTQILNQTGAETTVIEEIILPSAIGFSHYYRKAKFEKLPEHILVMHWTLNPAGQIIGFSLTGEVKPAESPYLNYRTENRYYFPIEKDAFVMWGGRKVEENYHVVTPNQRFAYDIGVVRDGRLMGNQGKKNTDYYCFGTRVYAPAAGTVLVAKDGVSDNLPGVINEHQILGNHVIIEHGENEYSFLAHLKKGSLSVNAGQTVTPETPIGQCGNSGRSTEPHLHFHLQDQPEFEKGQGVPVSFSSLKVNGKLHANYEPKINQLISRSN